MLSLSTLNNRNTASVGMGNTKKLDSVVDMIRLNGGYLQPDMACSSPRSLWYCTNVDMGVPKSAPLTPPLSPPLCTYGFALLVMDSNVLLVVGVPVVKFIGLGDMIPYSFDQSIRSGKKDDYKE